MRLPEVIGGSAVASLSHRRLQAEPWPVMMSIYAQSARLEAFSDAGLRMFHPTGSRYAGTSEARLSNPGYGKIVLLDALSQQTSRLQQAC